MLLPLAVALSLTAPTATAVRVDDPPVQIWIDPAGSLMQGDRVRVHVRTAQDAYVVVLRVDGDGRVRALFPLDPSDDDFARGGDKFEVRGRGDRDAFFVDERDGTGAVLVAAAKSPFKFDEFVRGDHWDYRVLASDQASSDPEAALLDLVRRMAGDQHFDYDVVTYTVGDIASQSYRYRPHYGGGYGYGGYGFGLGFGRPSYFCDPFFDFYCDSFYYGYGYDPFYYGGLRYGYCWWCAPRVFVYSRNVFAPDHPGFLSRFRDTRASTPPFVLPSNPVTRRSIPPVVTRPPVENQPGNARPADRPPDRRSTGDAKPSNRPTRDAKPADRPSGGDRRSPPDRAAPSRGGDNRSGGGQARPRNDSGRNHMSFFPERSARSYASPAGPSRSFSRSTPSFSSRSNSGGGVFRSMTRSGGGGSRSGGGGGGGRRR